MISRLICLIVGHKFDNVYGARISDGGNVYIEVENCCRCGKVFDKEVKARDSGMSFLAVMGLSMIIILSIFVIRNWFYILVRLFILVSYG